MNAPLEKKTAGSAVALVVCPRSCLFSGEAGVALRCRNDRLNRRSRLRTLITAGVNSGGGIKVGLPRLGSAVGESERGDQGRIQFRERACCARGSIDVVAGHIRGTARAPSQNRRVTRSAR